MPITALREIRILKSINHPSIVPLIDIASREGTLLIILLIDCELIMATWIRRSAK